jgi:Flp pilus assembly protein TadD
MKQSGRHAPVALHGGTVPKTLYRLFSSTIALAILVITMQSAMANLGAEQSTESLDPNYLEGKKALESQDWKKAIDLLSRAVQAVPNDSNTHNLLGYAYRKTGNFDASFMQYKEALKLDPTNKHAHEYIGEAYLLTGNVETAEQHLADLQKICSPIPCEEYKELKLAVEAYKKAHK